MKKWACLIGAGLMLVGCGKSVSIQNLEIKVEEEQYQERVYSRDEEEVTQLKAFSNKLADQYPNYHRGGESGHYLYLQNEIVQQMGVPLSESIYGQELEAIYPGILEFIKSIENETTDKRPKHIIIDNHCIRMVPMQLFDQYYTYGMIDYLSIENNDVRLEDAYMKQLAQAVPKDHFVVYEPYITGPQKLLRFATPSFGTYNYIGEYTDNTYTKGTTYYDEGGVAYQLYIAEDQVQKVRVMVEKLEGETLEQQYFDPLLVWCQDELGMNTDQLGQIQGLIDLAKEGGLTKKKGSVGDYLYSYKAFSYTDNQGPNVGEKLQKETIEIVIEMK